MKKGRDRIWMAGLLAALLALPVAARTIHLFEEEHASAADSRPSHDCSTCPVCLFAFSSFTGAEFIGDDLVCLPAGPEPPVSFCDKPYSPTLLSYGLRAPPVSIFN